MKQPTKKKGKEKQIINDYTYRARWSNGESDTFRHVTVVSAANITDQLSWIFIFPPGALVVIGILRNGRPLAELCRVVEKRESNHQSGV